MRKLVFILGLLLALCKPSAATWSAIQRPENTACANATTCTVTMSPAVTVGDVLVAVAVNTATSDFLVAGVSGSGTWVIPSGCHAFQAASIGISCAYILSATTSTTSIVVTLNAAPGATWTATVRQYHTTVGSAALDGTPAGSTSASCSACTTPSLTLTHSTDFLVAGASVANSVNTVNSPYGNLVVDGAFGDGVADNLNTSSGTGATFNQTAGGASMITIGFSEGSGAAAIPGMNKREKYELMDPQRR
jgi:hypothetical protein